MHYAIYKITNVVNGKFYVGAHVTENLQDTYMGSGNRIRYAIKKYGRQSFTKEILNVFENSELMYDAEAQIVTEDFIKRKDVYNIHVGGIGAPKGNTYGRKSWRTGKSVFSFKKGNKLRKGAKHSEEAKGRIAFAKIGNQHARKKTIELSQDHRKDAS